MRAAGIATSVLMGMFLLITSLVDESTRLAVAGIGFIAVAAVIPPTRKRER